MKEKLNLLLNFVQTIFLGLILIYLVSKNNIKSEIEEPLAPQAYEMDSDSLDCGCKSIE